MKSFMKCMLIRATRTVCQTALGVIGTATVLGDINWSLVISASAVSGLISVLTSIITGLPEVDYEAAGLNLINSGKVKGNIEIEEEYALTKEIETDFVDDSEEV